MGPGDADSFTLAATVSGCTVEATQDTAQVLWGCCTVKDTVRTTASQTVTYPDISVNQNLFDVWVCEGQKSITITNNGAIAYSVVLSDTLPDGLIYVTGSTNISSDTTHSFTDEPTVAGTPLGSIITWNSSNIDVIYPFETITITFNMIDDSTNCTATTATADRVKMTWEDSCGDPDSTVSNQSVTPGLPVLSVSKTPYTQTVDGLAQWTVRVSNTGTRQADSVRVTDILGNAFFDITAPGATAYADSPLVGWTTLVWEGQSVPVGSNTWTRTITADIDSSGDLTNAVKVEGFCSTGCIYSSATDTAFTSRV
ncbi:MAG: hypothetical protein ACE5OR_06830, partial [bacterium]